MSDAQREEMQELAEKMAELLQEMMAEDCVLPVTLWNGTRFTIEVKAVTEPDGAAEIP